jgi:tyrosyl-tRNA synthetase
MSKTSTDRKTIEQMVTRGVEHVVPEGELEHKLRSGKQLRVKLGIDPTGPNLHIGRAIVLWKLREFQKLGHQIVLIVGDFTAQIGDASDKDAMRPPLTEEQVQENLKTYNEQLAHVLDMDSVELRYNSEWLSNMKFDELLKLTMGFTVAQLIERENFHERYVGKKPIGLHEFLYPIMQGYDSYAIDADVELGGTDQLFNMLAGRKIQEHYGKPQQSVITTTILEGLDGRKMSTSWGNCIYITDSPKEQFGKVMSIGDNLIIRYFELATDISPDQIKHYKEELTAGANPRDIKVELAKAIVERYHNKEDAQAAATEFETIFSKGGIPDDIQTVVFDAQSANILDILTTSKLVASRAEARRLVEQQAVKVDGETVIDIAASIDLAEKRLIKAGKRRFVYVKYEA